MSTPVAGSLSVSPLYATPEDQLVLWDDPGQTWRGVVAPEGPPGPAGPAGPTGPTGPAGSGAYLPLAGGTLTGDLTIGDPTPVLILNATTGGTNGFLAYQRSAQWRWRWNMTNETEGAGNTGSNMALDRFADNGVLIDTPIKVDRDTGTVTLATPLPVASGGTGSATAAGARTSLGAVAKAGDTMTGALTVSGQAVGLLLSNASDAFLRFAGSRTWTIGNDGTGSNFWIYDTTGSAIRLSITNTGACFNTTGTWTALSDLSLKEEVAPYQRGLEAITALNPVRFRYKAGTPFAPREEPSQLLFGLVAAEVAPHIPEIVGVAGVEIAGARRVVQTLSPGDLTYVLINAVKELAARNDALEARLAALEAISAAGQP